MAKISRTTEIERVGSKLRISIITKISRKAKIPIKERCANKISSIDAA